MLTCTKWHLVALWQVALTTIFLSFQITASFAGIADAVLQTCLRALGMPGNCLAGILDDLQPVPDVAPESLLQAASYIGKHLP